MLRYRQIKNVDFLLCLRFRGIAKHLQSYTSKSPRYKREHQLLLLTAFVEIWRFSENKNKANAFYFICLLMTMLHRRCFLLFAYKGTKNS